jgi:predicted metal-dependent peptidase
MSVAAGTDSPTQVAERVKLVVAQAAKMAQQRGEMSGDLKLLVSELTEPKLDYRSILWSVMSEVAPSDYRSLPLSSKTVMSGTFFPNMKVETSEAVVHIDSSGSCATREQLTEFFSEVCGMATAMRGSVRLHLVVGDTVLHHYEVVSENGGVPESFSFGGGGGTSHAWVAEWIENNVPNTRLLISLTDGWSDIQRGVLDGLSCRKLFVLSKDSINEASISKHGDVLYLHQKNQRC